MKNNQHHISAFGFPAFIPEKRWLFKGERISDSYIMHPLPASTLFYLTKNEPLIWDVEIVEPDRRMAVKVTEAAAPIAVTG
jgi:hypothetical protein